MAQECAICAKSVVMSQDLATCFLDKYSGLSTETGAAVAVDLTACQKGRTVVQALPSPAMADEQPDTKFVLSRRQVECLRTRLADKELDLDPTARIDLGACQ